MAETTCISVRIGPNGSARTFKGRFGWALAQLIRTGKRGVTPIDHPAPRWSHYIYRLRREGIPIKTVPEKHGGVFPGRHGRYAVSDLVTVVANPQVEREAV